MDEERDVHPVVGDQAEVPDDRFREAGNLIGDGGVGRRADAKCS